MDWSHDMLRLVASAGISLLLAGTAAAYPSYGLFGYQDPQPPVAEDCGAVAAAIGPAATWYGEFAGNRYDNFKDRFFPFSARGCFQTEYQCRIWNQVAITYLDGGQMLTARCTQGHH
jgi:hypothetical protein